MRALCLATLALYALTACGAHPATPTRVATRGAPNPPDAFRDPARRTKIAAAVTRLDASFAEVAKKQKLPALAVGLVVDGDLVWSKGYGARDGGAPGAAGAPVDADTVFRIGSITKTFTAAAVLQLRDAGRLSLDEPAARWIPGLDQVAYPSADSAPITLRALLTHTSGLPRLGNFDYGDPAHPLTEDQITATLRGMPLARAPGVGTEYSNLGVSLVGIGVGHAAGMAYRDYVTQYLLRPLGMTSTAWDREAVPADRLATAFSIDDAGALKREEHWRLGASEAAGGLYSTVHDMARWAAMHLQAMPPRDEAEAWPVRRASLREGMTPREGVLFRVRAASPLDVRAGGVGFAWQAFKDCDLDAVVWHNGGTEGYSSALAMAPTRGVAVIALTNLRGASLDGPAIDALHTLAKAGAIAPRTPSASPAMIEARNRVLRLYDGWDDMIAGQLLSPVFVAEAGGLAKVRARYEDLRNRMGACPALDGDVEATSVTSGRFRMRCEHGTIDVSLQLATTTPVTLLDVTAGEAPVPPEALAKAAERVTALASAWSDATFDDLLFPTFEKGEMKAFFAKLGRDAGACRVERATGGDGAQQGKWRVACDKGPIDLELTIDGHNGRVGRMLLTPAADPDARCR